MEKVVLKQNIQDCLERNYPKLVEYSNVKIEVFFELKPLIDEVVKCLMLEYYIASITLINNILERLLKLALIYNETGYGPIPINDWSSTFEKPNKKYGSMTLHQSIIECEKRNLISTEQQRFLSDKIKELMRNGFSHADANKILSNHPDEAEFFYVKLANNQQEKISLNQKNIPPLQAILVYNFAKENSEIYLKYILTLLKNIETQLSNKSTCT